jgi:ankyrin repeat protein
MLTKVPTDLSKAIREGDLRTVQALLSRNPAYLHAPTPTAGGNWLHFAVRFPNAAILTYLLSHGLNVNSPDAEGVGPLAEAAEAERHENVQLLLDNGAALDVTTQ